MLTTNCFIKETSAPVGTDLGAAMHVIAIAA
jgi:hypothetical protein